MSNRLVIEPTEFKNTRSGEVTLGVRIYDDYDQRYLNTWDEIPDDDMELLERIVKGDWGNEIEAMLDHVQENKKGIYIGSNWYDWEDIEEIFCAYRE